VCNFADGLFFNGLQPWISIFHEYHLHLDAGEVIRFHLNDGIRLDNTARKKPGQAISEILK
jgi:hypothetical protein